MVRRLETVDPRKMKNDEKLAFWINIHNALLMHVMILHYPSNLGEENILLSCTFFLPLLQAHLEYGIPPNNLKKMSMLVKVNIIMKPSYFCPSYYHHMHRR